MSVRCPDPTVDVLGALQLQVAQRADLIASGQPKVPGLNLHCWLMAEREVLGGNPGEMVRDAPAEPAGRASVG